jgi:cysteine-rich repeat protein
VQEGEDAGGGSGDDGGGERDSGAMDDAGGGTDAGDGGTTDPPVCGDSVIDTGETCDDGNTAGGDYCSADCMSETGACGDSTLQDNEACDDGNTADGDYCSADCQSVTGSCGDGTLQQNENCDDGVTADCDGTHDGGDGTCVPAGTCSDGYVLDGADCIANPTGLSVPCQNGPGWTVFRVHYDSGSTSARVDVWDATCTYSFGNQACNVQEICPGFCDVDTTSQGYPVFTSSDYFRARFSVNGLSFTQAAVYIQARSYATSSSTYFDVWSPLYGGKEGGPVDQDFVYDWYGLDWTGYLFPSDDPGLTAIQIYGGRGSGSLAVKAVELCVQ